MIYYQIYNFLIYLTASFIISFEFDIFRQIRKIKKHPNKLTILEDSIFIISIIFVGLLLLFKISYGEIRFYNILAIFCGIMIYYCIIKRITKKLNKKIKNKGENGKSINKL